MCRDRELGSFTHYFHLYAAQRRGYRLLTACLPDSFIWKVLRRLVDWQLQLP
jgi:hypothetical protein